ncbi:hypothetical protein EUGRSUZ_D00503 [Eucalyptus grandis]|uniref:Uncharacterized protein n=2 Tax=Eucalyptus grandis TaxID=71139 RepID=A0ACC3L2S8_EUCGR|nr:hypothetical protein EUGRSUZ_D00503 [Eucalyptus grandis]
MKARHTLLGYFSRRGKAIAASDPFSSPATMKLDSILAEVATHIRQEEAMASLKLEKQFSTLQGLETPQTDRISHAMLNSKYLKASR